MQHDVVIDEISTMYLHCQALKFRREMPGMRCFNGKVNLPPLAEPPEPLLTFTWLELIWNPNTFYSRFENTIQAFR